MEISLKRYSNNFCAYDRPKKNKEKSQKENVQELKPSEEIQEIQTKSTEREITIENANNEREEYREFISKLEFKNQTPALNSDVILWPTLTDSLLEKSEFASLTFTQDESNEIHLEETSPVKIEAIKEEDLERLTGQSLSEKHLETFLKFTSFIKRLKDDHLYARLLEYKECFYKGQVLTIKLEILKDSCNQLIEKCWNLVSKPGRFDQECGDGRLLTCFTTIDSAIFNKSKADELLEVNNQVLEMTKDLQFNEYLLNLSKLYVQNYLDVFLQDFLELLLSFSTLKEKMDGWDSFQMIVGVLFDFLKLENIDKDLSQNNAFINDCKTWLSHVIACLIGSFSFNDSRMVLLHVLRTKGIGSWGLFFIQWNDSYGWDEDTLEHYLISLTCLLSPIEELESRIKSKLESIAYLEDQLKMLEREDWIVVHDDDLPSEAALKRSNSRISLKSIIMLENDYLGLLAQFKLKTIFEALCSKENQGDGNSNLKLISVGHHLSLILIRGIHIMPKDYLEVIRHLGDNIVFIAKCLGEYLDTFGEDIMNILISKELQSTMAIELDAFIERIFLRLSKIKGKPVWETISLLPFDKCTSAGKNRIAESMISLLNSDVSQPDSQAAFICNMVTNLFLTSSRPNPNTSANSLLDWDYINPEVVRRIFQLTFVFEQTRSTFAKFGQRCIYDISHNQSYILSFILGWIRDDCQVLEDNTIKDFCSKLNWTNFRAKNADLALLQSMLRDPENSLKAQIAMQILDRLNWGYSTEGSGLVFIPRYLHREIAIMVSNLYLDRLVRFESESIVSSVTATVEKTLQSSLGLKSNGITKFNDWIWKFICRLQLYQKPSSSDMYSADSLDGFSRPFLALESTALLSLRSTMHSEPLSAYVLLMVSDIGHHIHQFRLHALNLLSLLSNKGKLAAILLVFCYMLPTFSLDTQFYEDKRFIKVVYAIFDSNQSPEPRYNLKDIFSAYIQPLKKSQREEITFAIDFWHRIILSLPNYNGLGSYVLNAISQMCFDVGMSSECQESLSSIFKRKINEYSQSIEGENISISNPITSIYSLKAYLTRKYPQLVAPIDLDCDDRAWFALDGFIAEVRTTFKDRQFIGNELFDSDSQSKISFSGEINAGSLFRLAKEISSLEPNHGLAPIYLELFFSLYFESVTKNSKTKIFGYKVLMDSKPFCVEMIRTFIKKSIRKVDEEQSFRQTYLKNAYNAFSLWLSDISLLTDGINSATIKEEYLLGKFEDCIKGNILKSGKSSWNDIIMPLISVNSSTSSRKPPDPFFEEVQSHQLIPLPISKSVPIIPLRTPLFLKSNISLEKARSIVAVALNNLSAKASEFESTENNLKTLELEYIDKLKLVYTSSSIRNRTQKVCGKDCKSPAIFDYITYKIMAVSEIKLLLLDNRSNKEALLNLDSSDSKMYVMGLEIILMLEWLEKVSTSNNLDESIGCNIFFGVLEALIGDRKLGLFHISKYILKRIMSGFGQRFISKGSEVNAKLWRMMTIPLVVEMAGDIFHPNVSHNHFRLFFVDLASRFDSLGDYLTSTILSKFEVLTWLEESNLPDEIYELFKSIINWPIALEKGPKSFSANRKLLGDLLLHQRFIPMVPDAVSLCLSKVVYDKLSFITLLDATNALFKVEPENWQSYLDGLDLLETHFGRDELVHLIGQLHTVITNSVKKKGFCMLHFSSNIQISIIRLLALLFTSQEIYSMMVSIYFEELYSVFFSLYLAMIGIVQEEGIWNFVAPWPKNNSISTKYIFEHLHQILEKFCRNASQIAKLPKFYWELILIIQTMNLPDDVQECLFSNFESLSCWPLFVLSPVEIAQLDLWVSENKLSVPLTKCVFVILQNCELNLNSSLSQNLDLMTCYENLLLVIIYVTNQSQLVYQHENDRYSVLNKLNTKFSNVSWSIHISASGVDSLVDRLELLKWQTASTQIKDWKIEADPLVFTINFLQIALGIQKGTCSIDFYAAYKRFFFSILSLFISQNDSWNEAFSEEDITEIVFEFLNFAEDLRLQRACDSIDLGFFGFKELTGIFNRMSKNHDMYVNIWDGCQKALLASKIPLEYLFCSSTCFASVECMSLFNEKCIDRFLQLQDGLIDWNILIDLLVVPQLSIEQYVKCCLDNALLLQLFIYSIQELKNSTQLEGKMLIGEQVASWLIAFKPENLNYGHEGKIAPLLYIFAYLLSLEMKQKSVSNYSRLQSLVPNIANFLISLGEDRASGGLWSTLGFGPKSKYSVEFRFFCRVVGAFMASRVLTSQERNKLVESVESLHSNSDYEGLLLYLDPIMDDYLLADVDLTVLPDLIKHETMALFEGYFVGNFEI